MTETMINIAILTLIASREFFRASEVGKRINRNRSIVTQLVSQ